MIRFVIPLALAAAILAACEGPTEPLARGRALYDACSNCHGTDGYGNSAVGAPSIAGQSQWYIEAQLKKFRSGMRGYHVDDEAGLRMRPMSLALPLETDVAAVAQYISSLPAPATTEKLMSQGADAAKGQATFATCAACHGLDGGGNSALGAPPIAGQADWYIVSQLHKFKSGVRGALPADGQGATMRAIAQTLPDEAAMKDVAAYVSQLPHKNGT